jgi:acetyl/propionyl-CoA carboxylase alpha subunit
MAKIIAHAPDRTTALRRMRDAIASTAVSGVATNLPFHAVMLGEPDFRAGGVDTEFVARLLERDSLRVEGATLG